MEETLIQQLSDAGYYTSGDSTPSNLSQVLPVAIQCFKSSSLQYLSTITNIPLIQLLGISNEQPDPSVVYTEEVLDAVMQYAQAVAPDKKLFTLDWNVSVDEAIMKRNWATQRNLYFVPWSFQQESKYIPAQFQGDAEMEMKYFYGCLESSAIFHEFPDQAREIVNECKALNASSCKALCPYTS